MAELLVINPIVKVELIKIRVAAYIRVSTDENDQENSFINQYDHYMNLIKKKPEWDFVDMYADNGITGTAMKKRDDFNRLIEDCRDGKIDLVLVKSISRFARNTYDCIKTVRMLKALGVDVYFEKENINTQTMKTETEFAALSSMAQDESISISKNVRLAIRHQMMDGTYHYGKMPYGYRKEGTKMAIVEEEAKVVRLIFTSYIQGKQMKQIAVELSEAGILKRDGTTEWHRSSVKYIITNTTYMGDVLLQKSYTEDFPFKRKRNKGEKDMFYVKDYCPAIVSREVFEEANKRLSICSSRTRRKDKEDCESRAESIFANMMYCDECKTKLEQYTHSDDWKCSAYKKRTQGCPVTPITEQEIKNGFVTCYNRLVVNQDNILAPMINHAQEYKSLQNRTNSRIDQINNEIAQTTEQILIYGRLNAGGNIESAIYMQKTAELNSQIAKLKKEKKYLTGNNECDQLIKNTTKVIGVLKTAGAMGEFNETVFKAIVSRVWVGTNNDIIYEMINGLRLRINNEEVN